jgi:ankyrin repeat protein
MGCVLSRRPRWQLRWALLFAAAGMLLLPGCTPMVAGQDAATPLGTAIENRTREPIPSPGRVLNNSTKSEVVMSPSMRITATTPTGTITITAEDDLIRCYTWDGATRCAELGPRGERWYGSLGIAYPGPGDHWVAHHGITRGVLEEGQQHFQTSRAALHWIRSQWLPYVYRNDGLVVGWKKWLPRQQLNVEVWQIYIKGRKPQQLPGSHNERIAVSFTKRNGIDARLVESVRKDDLNAVRELLHQGADPNERNGAGWPVLVVAARRGYPSIVQSLLEKGADPNARTDARTEEGRTALLAAADAGHADTVEILLAKGANPDAAVQRGMMEGFTALMLAAMSDDTAIVRALLQAHANVDAQSAEGDTALKWAATQGHEAIAEMLLKRGARVDSRDALGMTPLMAAASSGNVDVVKLLIASGANVNARDDLTRIIYGRTLFVGDTKTQRQIEKTGKLNRLHEDGNSVLEHAAGNREIVALLRRAGALR